MKIATATLLAVVGCSNSYTTIQQTPQEVDAGREADSMAPDTGHELDSAAAILASMLSDRPADRLPVATAGERADIERILAPLTARLAGATRPVCRTVLTGFGTALLRTWEPRGTTEDEVSAPTSDHDWELAA